MLLLTIFLPLFNSVYIWVLDLLIGKRQAILIIVHSYLILMLFAFKSFFNICLLKHQAYLTVGTWINCGLLVSNWGFLFDSLSVVMITMVTFVSTTVHFYSIDYMKEDPNIIRFISYLSLFTFFMFILVTADNFIQLFFGWEGIGLCSYLLISFWNTRVQAGKAAFKALVLNRIGDFGFLLGLCFIFYFFRTTDFAVIFSLSPYFFTSTFLCFGHHLLCLDVICFCLFIGSIGKSAQIGLHTWLPDAMEGATPVSALIHAATLVTAGVFLVIRCSPLFELSSLVLTFISLLGGLTTLFGATVAIAQDDIKKIIAYSTCSQLGYMVFICGLSEYNLGIFHLVNHAFFKALLFLAAGSVIHASGGEQDIRKFGGLLKLIPFTYSMFLIGCFALCGFPFLSGFYSKDLILEIAFCKYSFKSLFCYWLGSVSAILTAFYSFRLLWYTFFFNNLTFKFTTQNTHELTKSMGFALLLLSIGSVFSGFFLKDVFCGIGTTFWSNAIYQGNQNSIGLDSEFINIYIKNIPVFFSLSGLSFVFYLNNKKTPSFISLHLFFNQRWHFDFIYNYYFAYSILKYSYQFFYKLIDKGLIELLGPYSSVVVLNKLSLILKKQSLGVVYHLNCILLLSVIIIMFIFIFT